MSRTWTSAVCYVHQWTPFPCFQKITDDIELYRTIHSPEDCLILQNDILMSNLCFSVMKCKVLHIGDTPYIGNYCLGRTQLEIAENIQDLGIPVDSKLKFHTHTDIVLHKESLSCSRSARLFSKMKFCFFTNRPYTERKKAKQCYTQNTITKHIFVST